MGNLGGVPPGKPAVAARVALPSLNDPCCLVTRRAAARMLVVVAVVVVGGGGETKAYEFIHACVDMYEEKQLPQAKSYLTL